MPSLISGIAPDLQPEFLQVVDCIYRKMVILQKGRMGSSGPNCRRSASG